jgi:hypothetical protein
VAVSKSIAGLKLANTEPDLYPSMSFDELQVKNLVSCGEPCTPPLGSWMQKRQMEGPASTADLLAASLLKKAALTLFESMWQSKSFHHAS